jgi:glyoxylase I family protein
MLKGFEHVGIAVSDLDTSLAFYQGLLGMHLVLRKPTPVGGGELAFVDAGNGQLELICPDPPVATPARRTPDVEAGVRHLTFAFDDVEDIFARLMEAGVEPLEKPRDALNREVLARVAFVLDPDGIVIELAQR